MINRPVLRYHGGKWMLAPWIISNLPPHRVYVEPFGGAASILLRKHRSYAEVYNDLDCEIANVFRVLRNETEGMELQRQLRLTPFARCEFAQAYEPSDCPIERARRTIIKSFMGFGSDGINNPTGFRNNARRSGTTPAHDWVNYGDCVDSFVARLQGVVIESRDAIDLVRQMDGDGVLFYVDPPYVMETREGRARYKLEMSNEQHVELSNLLHSVKGNVVLSGYDCELYQSLYSDWPYVQRDAMADGARRRVETLWFSPGTQQQLGLFGPEMCF